MGSISSTVIECGDKKAQMKANSLELLNSNVNKRSKRDNLDSADYLLKTRAPS
jgi:hypothetical protein